MQFSHFFAFALAFLSMGVFASAAPAAEEKRQINAVIPVIATLNVEVNAILAKIAALTPATAKLVELTPLVDALVADVDAAVHALVLIHVLKREELAARQESTLATDVGDLVSGIVDGLVGFKSIPGFLALAANLDAPLNTLLVDLNVLVPGIIGLVAPIVAHVSLGLTGLHLTALLATLGL